MKRFLCILLCCSFALGLGACGKKAEKAAPAEESAAALTGNVLTDSKAYADAYLAFVDITTAVTNEVTDRVNTNNAMLESASPDGYYMDPNYLSFVYSPFTTVFAAKAADAVLQGAWEGAVLSEEGNLFKAEYVYVDKTSGTPVDREGRCTWEIRENGAFRVRAYVDGDLAEFTEFIPLGGDRYFLYTLTDMALVTYTNGAVTALRHVQRICEPGADFFAGDVRYFVPDVEDYFPNSCPDDNRLALDDDALFLITLENGTMVFAGKVGQDQITEDGLLSGVQWIPTDPVTLLP